MFTPVSRLKSQIKRIIIRPYSAAPAECGQLIYVNSYKIVAYEIILCYSEIAKMRTVILSLSKDYWPRKNFKEVYAPVAQLDRVGGFEPLGCRFKSCRARL